MSELADDWSAIPADGRRINRYTPWGRKFIWCRRIEGQWVVMRHVFRRADIYRTIFSDGDPYDYALDDFEMMRKLNEDNRGI